MQNKSKIKPKTSQNIPDEDYLYFNTKEDEREAKSSIGVEYKVQHREFSSYNSDLAIN
jgi:hypothetical protein